MVFIRRSKVVPISLSLSRLGGLIIVNFTDVLIGYNRLQNAHNSSYTVLSFSRIQIHVCPTFNSRVNLKYYIHIILAHRDRSPSLSSLEEVIYLKQKKSIISQASFNHRIDLIQISKSRLFQRCPL